ncbi:MAG TPA: flavin reductase [Gemmatimonadaceae bacterium]|nr:flavin reductase [Gemmatimonadaceae bacterium]
MHWPARHIWDTRVQSVCAVVSARGVDGVELFLSANFAQVSLSPARVAINPNRLYPIEPAMRDTGRFAINIMPASSRRMVLRLMRLRRREPDKARVLGITLASDALEIPFLTSAMRTVFCEVESVHDTGDHSLFIARVLESRPHAAASGERPLLYRELLDGDGALAALRRGGRAALAATGALHLAKRWYHRLRPPAPADLPATTLEMGGRTDAEIADALRFGVIDRGRRLRAPAAPAVVSRRVAICVVGVGSWGSFHCDLVRKASPSARLFVCGRDPEHTRRVARGVGAEDAFIGLDAAIADQRVTAYTLALPHDLHAPALERIAAAGKHALVEKPIATTLADADRMIDAARSAGTILMVAEDMHFRPAVREASERIRRGDVGEPLYWLGHGGGMFRPRGWKAERQRAGGGVLMDVGVHYVRGLRLLMGEPHTVIASRAMQLHPGMSVEDSAQLIFASDVGWEAHLLVSWATSRGHLPDIAIVGEKGTLHLWPGAAYLDYYPAEPRPITELLSYVRPYWLQEKLRRPEQQRLRIRVPEGEGTGYLAEVREFLSAVSEGREPVTPPADARRDLEIVLAGYDSLERGARVRIPAL